MHADITCKNCGHQFTGNFCNQCGEKVYSDHDKTFKHFAGEAFHFLTHFDNKLFRTWWLIMTKPAKVSTDITAGIRKRYYKPINLFIIGVILYLLFPLFQALNMPLKNHFNELHRQVVIYGVKAKMESKHLTYEEVEKKYNEKSPKIAKLLLLIIIPLGGWALQLIFRNKRRYYFDHISLSAELNTFYLFFNFFIVPLLLTLIFSVARLFGSGYVDFGDSITVPLYFIAFGTYCYFAFRRFYNEKLGWAILKSVLFLLAHAIIVQIIYKLILFCVVLLFI